MYNQDQIAKNEPMALAASSGGNRKFHKPRGTSKSDGATVEQDANPGAREARCMTTPTPLAPKPVKAKEQPRKGRVARTRNAGTMTEAAFWSMLRSGLRRSFRYWKPAAAALAASKRDHPGPRGQRFAYVCASCKQLHKRTNVQIDHCTPCGALTSYEHLPSFVRNLTAEGPDAYQVLCKFCHNLKTKSEREFANKKIEKGVEYIDASDTHLAG